MRYPKETLEGDDDDGTMPANVAAFSEQVIGRRIMSADTDGGSLLLTLDNGRKVKLVDTSDCCAFTQLKTFLVAPHKVSHVITGVGTTGGYTRWHIYADLGDIMQLEVNWSCGNPFYYGYGFDILVEDPPRRVS